MSESGAEPEEDAARRVATEARERVHFEEEALGFADLHAWIGTQNYEMRADPDGEWLDERILEILRNTSAS